MYFQIARISILRFCEIKIVHPILYSSGPNCRVHTPIYLEKKFQPTWPYQGPHVYQFGTKIFDQLEWKFSEHKYTLILISSNLSFSRLVLIKLNFERDYQHYLLRIVTIGIYYLKLYQNLWFHIMTAFKTKLQVQLKNKTEYHSVQRCPIANLRNPEEPQGALRNPKEP